MSQFTIQSRRTYTEHQCRKCGGYFGMDEKLGERTWGGPNNEAGGSFWCPWCGSDFRGVGESDLDRARRDAKRADQRAKERLRRLEAERRSHAATKGVLTKTRKRVGKGVCPCCNRHFVNVEKHMAGQHPDYSGDGQ